MSKDINKRSAFSMPEIAARNGVSMSTIYRERRSGRLRTFKIRGKRMATAEDEERWRQSGADAA